MVLLLCLFWFLFDFIVGWLFCIVGCYWYSGCLGNVGLVENFVDSLFVLVIFGFWWCYRWVFWGWCCSWRIFWVLFVMLLWYCFLWGIWWCCCDWWLLLLFDVFWDFLWDFFLGGYYWCCVWRVNCCGIDLV